MPFHTLLQAVPPLPETLTPLALILAAVMGGLAGVLINYLADVLPGSRRLSRPACRACGQPFGLKGYLFAFRCPHCGAKPSVRSLLVLAGAVVCSLLLRVFPLFGLGYWASLPVLVFLGMILVIDIEHRLVLFETSLFGIALFLVYGILLHGLRVTLLGALAGFLIMFAFYLLGVVFVKVISRMRGKQINEVAFGFGDVMAGIFLGLLVGWPGIAGAIVLAVLIFGAFSLVLLAGLVLSKRYRAFASAQPFTPFLILGVVIIFYML